MLVNILSSEIKEWDIILTVKTVGFLARMGYNVRQILIKSEDFINGKRKFSRNARWQYG